MPQFNPVELPSCLCKDSRLKGKTLANSAGRGKDKRELIKIESKTGTPSTASFYFRDTQQP